LEQTEWTYRCHAVKVEICIICFFVYTTESARLEDQIKVLRSINKLGDVICIGTALEPLPKERFLPQFYISKSVQRVCHNFWT
jgi:hypothetical protein